MSWLCNHIWIEKVKTYAEPIKLTSSGGYSANDIIKIKNGVTTILWECSMCKELRKEEMLGREVKNAKL